MLIPFESPSTEVTQIETHSSGIRQNVDSVEYNMILEDLLKEN